MAMRLSLAEVFFAAILACPFGVCPIRSEQRGTR